jgi:phosphoribosylanthranilate isomerase
LSAGGKLVTKEAPNFLRENSQTRHGRLRPLRIKICGITNEDDGVQAASLGADAIGLNFYAGSPRCIDAATAGRIVKRLPPLVEAIAVFVNQPLRQSFDVLAPVQRIGTIQWHGDDPDVNDPAPYQLIAAFTVRDRNDLDRIKSYLDACRERHWKPAAVLLDAHVPGQYGGTGQTAPWPLLADFRPGVPVILAGGLTPENVPDAIRLVRPYAVDVASGVERSPGRKDYEKLRRFIGNAREAAVNCAI